MANQPIDDAGQPTHLSAVNEPAPTNNPTSTELQFVLWHEPAEHGFTVEVPDGWQVMGGVNWVGPTNAQQFVRVQSPDGVTQVFVGDPEIVPRQVPNALSWMQTGAAEGQMFRTPSGDPALMYRFLTGAEYAK